MIISIFSAQPFEYPFLEKANLNRHQLLYINERLTEQNAYLAKGSDLVCIFVNDVANEQVLHTFHELGIKGILLRSAGYNHVALDAARTYNIPVLRVPDYSPFAVAEHTTALILALNRKIIRAHNRIMDQNYTLNGLVGFDLHGKTVGIIGLGKIGTAMASIMHGFGCTILGYDIEQKPELVEKYNFIQTDLDSLCAQSDIITLHTPLNADTKYLINDVRIQRMKKGVMLINTSRGGLLHTKDVISALKRKHIGYLGLDVYEEESGLFFIDHSEDVLLDDTISRLLTFPNVLITSHQGFLTDTALTNIAETTLLNASNIEQGLPLKNLVP